MKHGFVGGFVGGVFGGSVRASRAHAWLQPRAFFEGGYFDGYCGGSFFGCNGAIVYVVVFWWSQKSNFKFFQVEDRAKHDLRMVWRARVPTARVPTVKSITQKATILFETIILQRVLVSIFASWPHLGRSWNDSGTMLFRFGVDFGRILVPC